MAYVQLGSIDVSDHTRFEIIDRRDDFQLPGPGETGEERAPPSSGAWPSAYLLMMHMPLVATAALVPFAGFPLLYLPMHVVWLELIIHPTALLVFQELPASDELEPVQRNRKAVLY